MTEFQKYINALRKCAKEHEKDYTPTFNIRVSDLCNDTADLLESEEDKEKMISISVIEDIKAEILELDYLVDNAKYSDSETRCHNVDYLVSEILKIIDSHISEEGSKENEDN